MFIGNYGNKYMLLQFLTSYYLQTLTFIYLIMRGVNENRREIIARPFCFNPRTYTRCDSTYVLNAASLAWFQSTHLHEVRRRGRLKQVCVLRGFNPRTYTRCDGNPIKTFERIQWFQSTHLHEVRLSRYYQLILSVRVSIHAPTRGAT